MTELIIVDEVHKLPARNIRKVVERIRRWRRRHRVHIFAPKRPSKRIRALYKKFVVESVNEATGQIKYRELVPRGDHRFWMQEGRKRAARDYIPDYVDFRPAVDTEPK